MKLTVLDGELAVARLKGTHPIPPWAAAGNLSSITRVGDELSVVCDASAVPAGVLAQRGFRCLRVAGPLDFSLTGILSSLAAPLAEAGISIFAVSTYDTDHILVRGESLAAAIESLRAAGHEVFDK